MSWKDEMNEALSAYASAKLGREVKVNELRYNECELSSGCDTCGYGSRSDVSIELLDDGYYVTTHSGDWASLMDALNG